MAIAAALAACAATSTVAERQRIAIIEGGYLVMPAAGDLTASFDAVQTIHAVYQDRDVAFEAHIRARPGELSIVALAALGGALFSIHYDGATLSAESAPQMRQIGAEFVLADVLLAHWNIDWLNARLEGAVIAAAADGHMRIVSRNGTPVIEIAYTAPDPWLGESRLVHSERGYVLDIATAEYTPL